LTVEELNILCKSTLIEHLGIEFTKVTEKSITATMPIDNRTIQPMKILHGGAIMALAETVGSAGSFNLVDLERYYVVGMEINGNHISSAKEGVVKAKATIVHQGKSTHVWDIRVTDQLDNLVSVCRITNMIIENK
jgi:1,4-dihydroxy-2-naphthoyl-CoA hydrolase